MITERSMVAVLNVYFDKRDETEALQAEACHHVLVEALIKEGYIPYRAGLNSMPMIVHDGDVFWDVAAQIKRALDPADIISRGRYLPPQQ
jgi:4-cresol dehydrogenase (hydroxylating)